MKKQAYNGLVAASLAALVLVSGCGGQAPGQGPTEVNSIKSQLLIQMYKNLSMVLYWRKTLL